MPKGRPPQPMLAREAAAPFDSPDHLFEIKWDGYRCLLEVGTDGAAPPRLWSRSGRDLSPEFRALVEDLPRNLPPRTWIDGELIAVSEGRPDFLGLARKNTPLLYVAFDLLAAAGEDLTDQPLALRRERLSRLIIPGPTCIPSEGVTGAGIGFFKNVVNQGLEGMMAKALTSPYLPGRRSGSWLKVLNYYEEEFPVVDVGDGDKKSARTVRIDVDGALVTLHGPKGRDIDRLSREFAQTPNSSKRWMCRVRHRGRQETGGLRHPSCRAVYRTTSS